MSHRFVTVRRGSPAARSSQIQPGDQLEAVEGRPVGGLQHRDLAQILRRAGNTLRISITPKHRKDSPPHTHTHIKECQNKQEMALKRGVGGGVGGVFQQHRDKLRKPKTKQVKARKSHKGRKKTTKSGSEKPEERPKAKQKASER